MKYLCFCLSMLVTAQTILSATNFSQINGFEPRFLPPANSTIVNIKTDYGAKGDGVTDDTKAFRDAIEADLPRTIYIPAGVYILSDSLRYGETAYKKKRTLLIGECRTTTILRLKANANRFNNPAHPKVFIHTRKSTQQGEQNMHMFIYHLTIEIGTGNSGAIALNFHTNNSGAVKDVAIRAVDPINGKGFRGIAFDDYWFGPGNGRYIEVEGFKTGVFVGSADNHTTLEHINVSKCDTGLVVTSNNTSIRDFNAADCKVGIKNGGVMALTECNISGNGTDAIINKDRLLCTKLTTSGFTRAISSSSAGGNVTSPIVNHYVSHAVTYNWNPAANCDKTLGLTVEESPEIQYPIASGWSVISASGDVGQQINTAISAGATDILVTGGVIQTTVVLKNNVRRIMGAGIKEIDYNTGINPVFKLENGNAPVVIVELLENKYTSTGTGITCLQASPRTLVFRHAGGSYSTDPAGKGGKVFIESVVGYPFNFAGFKGK